MVGARTRVRMRLGVGIGVGAALKKKSVGLHVGQDSQDWHYGKMSTLRYKTVTEIAQNSPLRTNMAIRV
jgi:hypothetical protein